MAGVGYIMGMMCMARTRLFGRVQQAASVAAEAATRNVSTDQVLAEHVERRLSRRDVLKLAGATGLAAGLSTLGGGRPGRPPLGSRSWGPGWPG